MRLDPLGLRLEAAFPELAGPHPSDLMRDDEPRPLENLDVLLHAGQRHLELIRETGDRRVRSPKLIDDPAAGRIGQRRKREIEGRIYILNHVVQYITCSRRKRKRHDWNQELGGSPGTTPARPGATATAYKTALHNLRFSPPTHGAGGGTARMLGLAGFIQRDARAGYRIRSSRPGIRTLVREEPVRRPLGGRFSVVASARSASLHMGGPSSPRLVATDAVGPVSHAQERDRFADGVPCRQR